MNIEAKIKDLGLELPEAAKPVAAYVPAVQAGNLVFTSGQLPMKNGKLLYAGKVGSDVSVDEGYEAAQQAVLNALAAVKLVIGDLDRIKQVVKVTGFVNSADGFTDQPKVINGASETLQKVFGTAGEHARAAVAANELPLNTAVEVEIIVEVA